MRKRREGRLGSSLLDKMSDRRGWVSEEEEEEKEDEEEEEGKRWAG